MTVQQLAIVVAAAIPLLAVSALAAADRRLSRKKEEGEGLAFFILSSEDDGGAGCSPCENCEKSIKPWRQLVKRRRRKKEGDFHVLPQQLLKDGCSE